jgi:transcriptional regulator with XRE-family HTH domain
MVEPQCQPPVRGGLAHEGRGEDRVLDALMPALDLAPEGLRAPEAPGGLPLRPATMLPPPSDAISDGTVCLAAHADYDSNRVKGWQEERYTDAITGHDTLDDVLQKPPSAEELAAAVAKAFLERAAVDHPEIREHRPGWQRRLSTAMPEAIRLSQSTISNLATRKAKSYRLDTLVKLRLYIGRPLDAILGLQEQGESVNDRLAELTARLEALEGRSAASRITEIRGKRGKP